MSALPTRATVITAQMFIKVSVLLQSTLLCLPKHQGCRQRAHSFMSIFGCGFVAPKAVGLGDRYLIFKAIVLCRHWTGPGTLRCVRFATLTSCRTRWGEASVNHARELRSLFSRRRHATDSSGTRAFHSGSARGWSCVSSTFPFRLITHTPPAFSSELFSVHEKSGRPLFMQTASSSCVFTNEKLISPRIESAVPICYVRTEERQCLAHKASALNPSWKIVQDCQLAL